MLKSLIYLFPFLLITPAIWAQKSSKKDDLKFEQIFLDPEDQMHMHYLIIYPKTESYKGYVLLFPGFGEYPAQVVQETQLPIDLANAGYLTIIPTLQNGSLSFGVDSASVATIHQIHQDVLSKNKLTNTPLILGGFSIGGSAAVKFAQQENIHPSALFAIDPPLDFERYYQSAERFNRISLHPNQENNYVIGRLNEFTGGSPATHQQAYYALSPYSYSDANQTAVRATPNIPIRFYTEPDILWWMKERSSDYTQMNSIDCAAMINELNLMGNTKAQLIVTQNKGVRKSTQIKHPHAWSLIDSKELISWLNQIK